MSISSQTGRADPSRLCLQVQWSLRKRIIKTRLIAHRGDRYASIRDLWLRSGLTKSDIERLADADAFGTIGLSRREALWAVRALDVKSAAEVALVRQGQPCRFAG